MFFDKWISIRWEFVNNFLLPLALEMSMKTTITVDGMSCGHCSNAVKNLIEEVAGVESAEVNLTTKDANVSFDPNATDLQTIINNINSSDIYKATAK